MNRNIEFPEFCKHILIKKCLLLLLLLLVTLWIKIIRNINLSIWKGLQRFQETLK